MEVTKLLHSPGTMIVLKGVVGFAVASGVAYFFGKGKTYWASLVISLPWNTLIALTFAFWDVKFTQERMAEFVRRTAFGLGATAIFGAVLAVLFIQAKMPFGWSVLCSVMTLVGVQALIRQASLAGWI